MAIHLITKKASLAHLFPDCKNTMVLSCLQDCMGLAYAHEEEHPKSAQISVGDFISFAGPCQLDLVRNRPENLHGPFSILVPPDEEWAKAIEKVHGGNAERITRYALRQPSGGFDRERLQAFLSALSPSYTLQPIDEALYHETLASDWAGDLCINFETYADFAKNGLGVVALRDGEVVSGASSYTYYREGIEIQVDTREDMRRKGLALCCSAKLILTCLDRGLAPSWDAHNEESLALAQKLGYEFDGAYVAYEVIWPQ